MRKSTKQVFQLTTENQAKLCEDWSGYLDVLWFQVGLNSLQSEKTSFQVNEVPKLTVSFKHTKTTMATRTATKVKV